MVEEAKSRSLPVKDPVDFESHTGGGVTGKVEDQLITLGKAAFLKSHNIELSPSLSQSAETLQSEAKTVVWVARDQESIGLFGISDPVEESTPAAVEALHKLGIRLIMATGDNEATARAVGNQLDIDEVHAGLSPQEKIELVRNLKAEGLIVAMAGDGINDAPALAEANVGIAMGTGTYVAIQSASAPPGKGDLMGIS